MSEKRIVDQDLRAILHGYSNEQFRFEFEPIGIHNYIVLGQARLTFNDIPSLGDDIAWHGLIQPITIGRFTKEYAQAYLDMNNELWGLGNVLLKKPTTIIAGVAYWDILIAGERRTRATRYAWENGCSLHRDAENRSKNWLQNCRKEHFPESIINASIAYNIPPSVAVSIQFRENQHNSVPSDEEAVGLDVWFAYLRKRFGDQITLKQYVSVVRRSENKVRDSVHFCSLPLEIREAVALCRQNPDALCVTYGFTLQVYRICEFLGYDSEEEIIRQYRKMVLEGYNLNSRECDKYVLGIVKRASSPQTCMLDEMMSQSQKEAFKRDNHKKVVEEKALRILDASIAYFGSVLNLFRNGELGKKDSLFSMYSVVRMFLRVTELLGRCLPYILEHLPKDRREISERTIAQTLISLRKLENHLGKKSKGG